MKRFFAAILMTLGAVLAMPGLFCAAEKMTHEELNSLLDRPDVVVIDLRSNEEWQASPLKVPHAEREDPAHVSSWAAKYSKGAIVVLYCS